MKIAIFGGSGRVGQALIPALLEQGHTVRVLQHRGPVHVEADIVEGSMTDPAAVAHVIDDTDIVLQMAMVGNDLRQIEISVQGTIHILDAIRRTRSVRQYLLTSSDAANGIWHHPFAQPIDHQSPPASYPGLYSLGKVLEETIVREYHRNHALAYTIARLSWVQQEDSILRHFVAGYDILRPTEGPFSANYLPHQKQMLEMGHPFIVMPCGCDGKPLRRTMVHREDVINALVRMIGQPKAAGQTFQVSGPAFDFDTACQYLSARLPLPVEKVLLDAHSFDIDTSHTTDRLGWTPRYDVIDMLDAALAWRECIE